MFFRVETWAEPSYCCKYWRPPTMLVVTTHSMKEVFGRFFRPPLRPLQYNCGLDWVAHSLNWNDIWCLLHVPIYNPRLYIDI